MKQPTARIRAITCSLATTALASSSLLAGDYGKAIIDDKMPIEEPWSPCDLFDYSTLYENDTGFIREVALNGRYQGQYISQSEDIGAGSLGFNQWQHRRARLGIDVDFANDLSFSSSFNISDGAGVRTGLVRRDFFNDIDEMYIKWAPEDVTVKIGKQKQEFSREYSTSSKRIKTIERSQIVNETADAKPWGVTAEFKTGELTHQFGGWLYGLDGVSTPFVPGFEGFGLPRGDSRGGLSYFLTVPVTEATDLHFDYVYTNNSSGNALPRGSAPVAAASSYNHTFALGTESDFGRFDLVTDIIAGIDRNPTGTLGLVDSIPAGEDTWGLVIMPTYEVTEKLEAVAKYAYMDSGRQQRTQRFPLRTRVEDYSTFYVGLNYYLCGDKFKVMTGYEYATGETFGGGADVSSDSWMFAVRTYF